MAFAIKAEVPDPQANEFAFIAQKTMYGGKHIAAGDEIFVFASENEGGVGLIAAGVVATPSQSRARVAYGVRRRALALPFAAPPPQSDRWGAARSSHSRTGRTVDRRQNSTLSFIARRRTRSLAFQA